jgi:hypothetical protein
LRITPHSAGLSVTAQMTLRPVLAAMVSANCRKSEPLIPGRKAVGTKTAISTSPIAITAPSTSCIAFEVASLGARCDSFITRSTFSTTTIASSTRSDREHEPEQHRQVEKPAIWQKKVPMIETGTQHRVKSRAG